MFEKQPKINVLFVLPPEYFIPTTIHCRDLKDNLLPTLQRRFIPHVCDYDTDFEKNLNGKKIDLILYSPPIEAINQIPARLPDFQGLNGTPVAGFLNGDKYSPLKLSLYRLLKQIGAVACFCTCEAPGELSYIDDDLPFYHLNMALYINGSVFRDYQENKIIPLGFFGGGFDLEEQSLHYPWRQNVFRKLYKRCPSFISPRPTDISIIKSGRNIELEKYARLLNSCQISFTCGSHQNKILGKHLEIPACRCCMVAEDMPMLKEYGFIDMINCVTADENNIVEKIDYLFSDRQELKRITDAGYRHVKELIAPQSQYNTIYEWFKLFIELKPDEKIVQTGAFALEVIKKNQSPQRNMKFGPDVLEEKWLEGYQALQNNDVESALNYFNEALKIIPYCPEANTGLGIILLLHSKALQAEMFFTKNIQHVTSLGGLSDFHDPIDIALIIICKICQNKQEEAQRLASYWIGTNHPALDAARFLATGSRQFLYRENNSPSRLPVSMTTDQWLSYYSRIVEKHGIFQKKMHE